MKKYAQLNGESIRSDEELIFYTWLFNFASTRIQGNWLFYGHWTTSQRETLSDLEGGF